MANLLKKYPLLDFKRSKVAIAFNFLGTCEKWAHCADGECNKIVSDKKNCYSMKV